MEKGPWPYMAIIFLSFLGFLVSFYVSQKKSKKETMLCPVNFNCDSVIYSDYSSFFGIGLQYWGMVYYGALAIVYGAFLAFPSLILPGFIFVVTGVTIVAFLFSLYLTFIQAFTIKNWCSWCLTSAGLSTLIFVLVVFGMETPLVELLADHRKYILLIHFLGAALGLGGATIADVLFFKFLKDFRISEQESEVLRSISQVIWFALAMIILSGVGLFLPNSAAYLVSAKFLAKMFVVSVIVLNGLLLNFLVSPKLIHISFGKKHDHEPGELRSLRSMAFALGAVSISSWYFAFLLAFLGSFGQPFFVLVAIYLVVIICAMLFSKVVSWNLGMNDGRH